MHGGGLAQQHALGLGAEEVGLEFDGGEAACTLGQVGPGGVAGSGVGQRDDRRGVQVAVGRQHLRADQHARRQPPGGEAH